MKKTTFKDDIKNWTDDVALKDKSCGAKFKTDKNFNKHHIKPCVMMTICAPTGGGKSTLICDFLARKNEAFYAITIFSGSTIDEPLVNMLSKNIEGIIAIDDADELPELSDLNDEDKKHEKLMVFDDIINLPKKQLAKIQRWFNSSRKYGYTCISTAQNYTDLPIQMRRNTMVFFIGRLNDNNTINNILKNHDNGYDKDEIKRAYWNSTQGKGNFFCIDFTSDDQWRFRHNFLDPIPIHKTFSM